MIKHTKIDYKIKFQNDVIWNKTPSMIFRSVLGMQLKRSTCVLKKNTCCNCPLNSTCVYATFFETPIEKDKEILMGRNFAPHPFTLEVSLLDHNEAIVSIVFIGLSRNYIPYITIALERAGEQGISKSRTGFDIISILNDDEPFEFNLKNLDKKSKEWPNNEDFLEFDLVKFLTPVRIKKQGRYIDKISASDFLLAIERRVKLLDALYGDSSFEFSKDELVCSCEIIDQRWIDLNYYSSRQKSLLKIGGVVGAIKLVDGVDLYHRQLFKAAEVFNIGKNISMGLGSVQLV